MWVSLRQKWRQIPRSAGPTTTSTQNYIEGEPERSGVVKQLRSCMIHLTRTSSCRVGTKILECILNYWESTTKTSRRRRREEEDVTMRDVARRRMSQIETSQEGYVARRRTSRGGDVTRRRTSRGGDVARRRHQMGCVKLVILAFYQVHVVTDTSGYPRMQNPGT